MAPSTIYKLSLLCNILGCMLLTASLGSGADVIPCYMVEEVAGTASKPRSILQTPIQLLLTDSTGLTSDPPVTSDPKNQLYFVADQSGQLKSRKFSSCEMTHHMPQEVPLDWARSLTEEQLSPPSLGRPWYSVSLRDETDGYSVSAVLGPRGEKDNQLAVSLAVYSPSVSASALLNEPLTMPCFLWRGQQSRFSVEWRHRSLGDGKVLYAYDGRLDRVVESIPGYTMNFSALHSSGDATLTLERTETAQQGTFLCTVYLPYVRAQRDIQLQVTARPRVMLFPDPLFARPNEELTLSCDVSHFHPLEVSVEFLVRLPEDSHPSLLGGTILSTQSRNQDGTFSIIASQSITATPQHHGARYSCRVQHLSAPGGVTRSLTLKVAGVSGPSLEDGMYLFVVALILYGLLSFLCKKVLPFFGSSEETQEKSEKKKN
ncbi:tapasin [Discoglossus pictus]